MPASAAFEVIGGPMDGLGALFTGPGTAGRKVGNALSLALDDQVSGQHLEIFREGHDWCVRDLQSTNGTFQGQRLEPGRSYPLKPRDVLLLGTTVLLHTQVAEGDEPPLFGRLAFDDPRRCHNLGQELTLIWQQLMDKVADPGAINRLYCDADRFFLAIMAHIRGEDGTPWACEQLLASSRRYQILTHWLHEVPVERNYQSDPDNLTVAPRLWRLFETAAGDRQEPLTIPRMLAALIGEGRSLAARHIANDSRFLTAYRAAIAQDDEAAFIAALRDTVIPTEALASKQPQAAVPAPPAEPEEEKPSGGDCSEVWTAFVRRLETLVTGFATDATNPMSEGMRIQLPGLGQRLEEVTASPLELGQRLDGLYTLLVAILAAQRDGCRAFGHHFLAALEMDAAELLESRGHGLNFGKKSLDIDEWLIRAKTVLARMENDGASDALIRHKIIEKLSSQGHEPPRRRE